MNLLNSKFLMSLIQSDLLVYKKKNNENLYTILYSDLIKNIKQFYYILKSKKKIPIYIIPQNKTQGFLIKNFLLKNKKFFNIYIISLKTSSNISTSGIFILLENKKCDITINKILKNSNSLLFLINNNEKQLLFGSYKIFANTNSFKSILFILSIIKKIYATN